MSEATRLDDLGFPIGPSAQVDELGFPIEAKPVQRDELGFPLSPEAAAVEVEAATLPPVEPSNETNLDVEIARDLSSEGFDFAGLWESADFASGQEFAASIYAGLEQGAAAVLETIANFDRKAAVGRDVLSPFVTPAEIDEARSEKERIRTQPPRLDATDPAERIEAEAELKRRTAESVLETIRGENPTFAREVQVVVGSSLGASLPTALETVATRGRNLVYGLAPLALREWRTETEQLKDEGVAPWRAELAGLASGVAEAGFELMPLRTIFDSSSPLRKRLLDFVIQEESTELATTFAQAVVGRALALSDENAPGADQTFGEWLDQTGHEIALTAVSTPFSAGLQAGGVATIERTPGFVVSTAERGVGLAKSAGETVQRGIDWVSKPHEVTFTPFGPEVVQKLDALREAGIEVEAQQALLDDFTRALEARAATLPPDIMKDDPGLVDPTTPQTDLTIAPVPGEGFFSGARNATLPFNEWDTGFPEVASGEVFATFATPNNTPTKPFNNGASFTQMQRELTVAAQTFWSKLGMRLPVHIDFSERVYKHAKRRPFGSAGQAYYRGAPVGMLNVLPTSFLNHGKWSVYYDETKNVLWDTITHELGHMAARQMLAEAPKGTKEILAREIFDALEKSEDRAQFMKEFGTSPQDFVTRFVNAPNWSVSDLEMVLAVKGKGAKAQALRHRYWYDRGLTEWIATRTAREGALNPTMVEALRAVDSQLVDSMEKLTKSLANEMRASAQEVNGSAFRDFFNRAMQLEEVNRAAERASIAAVEAKAAFAEMAANPPEDVVLERHKRTLRDLARGKIFSSRSRTLGKPHLRPEQPVDVASLPAFAEVEDEALIEAVGEYGQGLGGIPAAEWFSAGARVFDVNEIDGSLSEIYSASRIAGGGSDVIVLTAEVLEELGLAPANEANPRIAALQKKLDALETVSHTDTKVDPKLRKRFAELEKKTQRGAVTYNWYLKWLGHLTHLRDYNPRSLVPELHDYVDVIRASWAEKNAWLVRAGDIVGDALSWRHSSNAMRKDLGVLMIAADERSSGPREFNGETREGRLQDDELAALIEEEGLTNLGEHGLNVAQQMWAAFEEAAVTMRERAKATVLAQGLNDVETQFLLDKIDRDFTAMQNRNYFPHTRFGRYSVTVKVPEDGKAIEFEGQTFKAGETVYFETYPTKRSRRLVLEQLRKALPKGVEINEGMLTDSEYAIQGLPPAMQRVISENLQLTAEQEANLERLAIKLSPGNSFRKRMIKRTNVLGFSDDAVRVFAEYFQRYANYTASMRMREDGQVAIDELGRRSRTVPDGTKLNEIQQHMKTHLDYMLNPGNELVSFRALAFHWYLAAVPKAALVNLSQLPMVTYPALSARFGDFRATRELGLAIKDGMARLAGGELSAEEEAMISVLKDRDILAQSAATDMAGIADGTLIDRYALGESRFGSVTKQASSAARTIARVSTIPFQAAETANRYVTALASYRLARKGGLSQEEAINFADDMTQRTQFEYSRWNRPELFRGKKGVFFVFQSYVTNMAHFIMKDPGSARYLLMLFGLAGLSGMPFAENVLDMFDALFTRLRGSLGLENPKVNSRAWLMEQMADIGEELYEVGVPEMFIPEPQTLMYGASRMGPFDLHASMGMGDIVPFITPLAREGGVDQQIGQSLQAAGGAAINIPLQMIMAIGSDEADPWRRWEKAMPSYGRMISQSLRWYTRGEETDFSGNTIVEFDMSRADHRREVIGRALGFTSTRVNEERNARYLARDTVKYYEGRRRALLGMLWQAQSAQRKGDAEQKEKVQEIRQRIWDFNKTVPDPSLKIGYDAMLNSMRARARRAQQTERNIYPGAGKRLYREVYEDLTPDRLEDRLRAERARRRSSEG